MRRVIKQERIPSRCLWIVFPNNEPPLYSSCIECVHDFDFMILSSVKKFQCHKYLNQWRTLEGCDQSSLFLEMSDFLTSLSDFSDLLGSFVELALQLNTDITYFWQQPLIFLDYALVHRAPQGGLEIPLSRWFFAQITPRNCVKFMLTPSLPNHAKCQIDLSRNYAIFSSNSRLHALTYVKSRHHAFPLGGQ